MLLRPIAILLVLAFSQALAELQPFKFSLEDINRALDQPEDNRLIPDPMDRPVTAVEGEALFGVEEAARVPDPTPTVDGELLTDLAKHGLIEGTTVAPETSWIRRKRPGKDTTIWTTVTPPTRCTKSDGCCPEDITTLTITTTITSEDLFQFTVTETVDVTVFRGVTLQTTILSTLTSNLVVTSTIRREGTVTTTSFLTTTVPITRVFIRTIRSFTPDIRTFFINTSTTSTRFGTVTERSETTIRTSGNVTLTETSFISTRFSTNYNTFTQTVFNPLTIADVTVFSFIRATTTVILGFATNYLTSDTSTLTGYTFTETTTLPAVSLSQLDVYTTTASNVFGTVQIVTSKTYSRLY